MFRKTNKKQEKNLSRVLMHKAPAKKTQCHLAKKFNVAQLLLQCNAVLANQIHASTIPYRLLCNVNIIFI